MLRRIAMSKKQHKDNNNTHNMSFTLGYFLGGFLYWDSSVFNLENKFKRMPFWNHTELLYWHLFFPPQQQEQDPTNLYFLYLPRDFDEAVSSTGLVTWDCTILKCDL